MHKCESKYIVEVNNVLKDIHRKRIQETPFRWCLEVDNALEINCPLLREVLRRWVPQGEYTPVQEGPLAAVVFNILHRFGNRSILGRAQKSIAFGLG